MPGKNTKVCVSHLALSRKLRNTVQLHHRLIWAFNLNIPLLAFFVYVCDQNLVSLQGYFKGRHKAAKSHTTFSYQGINLDPCLFFFLLKCWKEMWGLEWDDCCKKTWLVLLPLLLCPKVTIRSGIPLCHALSTEEGTILNSEVCSID